jgi:hypothetical protein
VKDLTGPTWLTSGRRPEAIALFWGFLLPIEYVLEIPNTVLDLPRYGIAAVLALSTPATLRGESRSRVLRLSVLLAVLAVIRTAMSFYHDDRAGLTLGVVLLGSVLSCGAVALRPRLHRTVLLGFMLGVSFSGIVCLMQALGIPTLRPSGPGEGRFPGLSTYTMLLTWQVLWGGLIAAYFLFNAHRRSLRWRLSAVALPICAAALLINGAQGGLLGLAAGGVAYFVWCGPEARRRLLTPRSLGLGALAGLVLVGLLVASGFPLSTFQDWIFHGNFVNEQARVDIARTGWQVMLDHPVTGYGRTQLIDTYTITPHFLPLESAASAGIVAGIAALVVLIYTWYLMFKGPTRGAYALFGSVLLAAMCSNTLTEISGPFIGVSHLFLLLIAVVAAAGGNDPSPGRRSPPDLDDRALVESGTET